MLKIALAVLLCFTTCAEARQSRFPHEQEMPEADQNLPEHDAALLKKIDGDLKMRAQNPDLPPLHLKGHERKRLLMIYHMGYGGEEELSPEQERLYKHAQKVLSRKERKKIEVAFETSGLM